MAETGSETLERNNRIARAEALVKSMGLEGVPTAKDVDPENKYGLQGVFREDGGIFNSPLPDNAIRDALQIDKEGNLIRVTPGEATQVVYRIPLFREQVLAIAQFLD